MPEVVTNSSDGLRANPRTTRIDLRLVAALSLLVVLGMIASFVEAQFKFPRTAVPFCFFIGFGLGLIRWQLGTNNHQTAFADSPAN